MLDGIRVLVVEEQFLIALEIQRILEAAQAAHTVFARRPGEAHALADRWTEFELAVIELPPGDGAALDLLDGLRRAGVAVVVSSADPAQRPDLPAIDDAALVVKPFGEAELLAACGTALALRSPAP